MKKFNLPLAIDGLFLFTVTLFITRALTRYYLSGSLAAWLIALLFASLVGCGFYFVAYKLKLKRYFKRENERAIRLFSEHLAFSSEEDVADLFKELAENEGKCLKKRKGYYAIIDAKSDENEGCAVFTLFKIGVCEVDDVAKIIRLMLDGGFNECVVYSTLLSEEAKTLIDSFKLKRKSVADLYDALDKHKLLPQKYLCAPTSPKPFKTRLRAIIDKRKSNAFLASGIFLVVYGLISFFPTYYIISGCVLLALSVVARFAGKSKAEPYR